MSCVVYLDSIEKKEALKKISEYLQFELVNKMPAEGSFIDIKEKGLCFTLNSKEPSHHLNIDFLSGSMGWRLKRANHEKLLKKTYFTQFLYDNSEQVNLDIDIDSLPIYA